jgi:hypothetical protein
LSVAEPLLERNFHPTVIIGGYMKALQASLEVCKQICRTIDINNDMEMREIVSRDRNQVLLSLGCVFVWFVWRLLSLIVVVDHSCRWTDGGHGDQGGQEGHSEER